MDDPVFANLDLETRNRLVGIHQLIADILGKARSLGDILAYQHLTQEQITRVKQQHLEAYLLALIAAWRDLFCELLPPRRWRIIEGRYSLDGQKQATLAELAVEFNITRMNVRQLENTSLNRLKSKQAKGRLLDIAGDVARAILRA